MKDTKCKKLVWLFFLFLSFPFCVFSQNISVSGTITDEFGDGMPGVNIVVEGTSSGTISDINGRYQISTPSAGKLVFSFIGYLTQTIDVGSRTTINVVMKEDSEILDELVVVGYGTMKRSDLTGAVSSVSTEAIGKTVSTSIDQVLQGRVAGVQVQQNSGAPGATSTIRIRGTNSINSTNEPIYVIDGVVIDGGTADANTNPLASINPADIVSMDILKDASATAIYGSRASNGVIMITTKRGQKGEATINYSGYMGMQEMPGKLSVLNLQQFAEHRNNMAELGLVNRNSNYVRPDLLGKGTDWQDQLFRQALMQTHNLSIGGGNDQSTYNLSAGYLNQDGIAEGSGFSRLNLNGSFDSQVKKWLKAGINFAFNTTKQEVTVSDQQLINLALRTTPDVPAYNADGSFGGQDDAEPFIPKNPKAFSQLIENKRNSYGIRSNTYLDFAILKSLSYKTEFSFDYTTATSSRFEPTWQLSNTQFNETNSKSDNSSLNKYWSWRNIVTFNKTFAAQHAVNIMGGQEMSKSQWQGIGGSRTGFISNSVTDLNAGDVTTASNSGYSGAHTLLSFFGRAFYAYKDRYLLTATLRYDGSSNFAEGNRWGLFPSAALAWRLSEEDFIKNIELFDNLKLRAGWGKVGNQNVGNNRYAWNTMYRITSSNWGSGLVASNTPNLDLTWETTSSYNAGVDIGILRNRVDLVFDFYYKRTDNLLMEASLPAYVGTSGTGASSKPWVNLGSIENKGIEIALNTKNIMKKNFAWDSNFTFSLNRNKVLEINTQTGFETRSVNGNEYGVTEPTIINYIVPGKPIGMFYGYRVIGRFESAEDFYYKDADGNIQRTPVMSAVSEIDEKTGVWIGDYIYKDLNEDGVIDENDMDYIGNPEPKFTFGIGNTFTFFGFDLNIFLTGSYGNDVVNYTNRYLGNPYRNISNLLTSALDYAKLDVIDPNLPVDYRNVQIIGGDPKACRMPLSTSTSNYNYAFSDRFIEDGSYLRIQNITLGYTIPRKLTEKIGISNLRVYGTAQNIYTFTKYSGYDPEIGTAYINGNYLTGIDNGRYPSPRIYTLGLNLTF